MDNGLLALALAAQLHHVPVDAARLAHEFGSEAAPCGADDLLRAAIWLGFKARKIQMDHADLDNRLLPALGVTHAGAFFVLAKSSKKADGSPVYLVQQPGEAKPVTLESAALEELWSGELLLLLRRHQSALLEKAERFNLRWFLPALARYRH